VVQVLLGGNGFLIQQTILAMRGEVLFKLMYTENWNKYIYIENNISKYQKNSDNKSYDLFFSEERRWVVKTVRK
jgi:hypothetical protein